MDEKEKQEIIAHLELDLECANKNMEYHRGLADGLERAIRLIQNPTDMEKALQELVKAIK